MFFSGFGQGAVNPATVIGIIVSVVGVLGGAVLDGNTTRKTEKNSGGSPTEVVEETRKELNELDQGQEKIGQQTSASEQAEAEAAADGGAIVKEDKEIREMGAQVEEDVQQIRSKLSDVSKLFGLMRKIGQHEENGVPNLPGRVLSLVEKGNTSRAQAVIEANIEDSDKSKDEFYTALGQSAEDLGEIEELEGEAEDAIERQIEVLKDEEMRIDKAMSGKRKTKLERLKKEEIEELENMKQDLETVIGHTEQLRELEQSLM